MSVEDILKGFVGILEENFPDSDQFRTRDIPIATGKVIYINDEDVDRHDEIIEEGIIELSSDIDALETSGLEPRAVTVPISAVDASSALSGETNQGIVSASRTHKSSLQGGASRWARRRTIIHL